MKAEFELKYDWRYLGGPEGQPGETDVMVPAGTKVGVIETSEGSHMTPQQLADAVVRGLVGEVHADEEAAKPARRGRGVKDE